MRARWLRELDTVWRGIITIEGDWATEDVIHLRAALDTLTCAFPSHASIRAALAPRRPLALRRSHTRLMFHPDCWNRHGGCTSVYRPLTHTILLFDWTMSGLCDDCILFVLLHEMAHATDYAHGGRPVRDYATALGYRRGAWPWHWNSIAGGLYARNRARPGEDFADSFAYMVLRAAGIPIERQLTRAAPFTPIDAPRQQAIERFIASFRDAR